MNPHSWSELTSWTCFMAMALACGGGSSSPTPSSGYTPLQEKLAGLASINNATAQAFNKPFPSISNLDRITFESGDFVFGRAWVPSQDVGNEDKDGLGPLFNAESCNSCHISDGRSRPPEQFGVALTGLLIHLSSPARDANGGTIGDSKLGGQFNDRSLANVQSEGVVHRTEVSITGQYEDGTTYELLKPIYSLTLNDGSAPAANLQMSPRTAPAMVGLGLLEAITEAQLLALEDTLDADQDGISGKINRVWNVEQQAMAIGRMGWKAEKPNIRQQSAGAFNGDIGVTSSLFPEHDFSGTQTQLSTLPDGKETGETFELKANDLDALVFYLRRLAVPQRRNVTQASVVSGEASFYQAKCNSCHSTEFQLGTVASVPEFSNQIIHPFTDMLLHDMGSELSDERPVFSASGNEWRTPPLWGIGLVSTVNGHTRFLHDGRAKSLEEAILWHGGEGSNSRDLFKAMNANERANLISFLESL
jgi:CxxC motif-containing protein (DUF1111 family)